MLPSDWVVAIITGQLVGVGEGRHITGGYELNSYDLDRYVKYARQIVAAVERNPEREIK